MRLWFVRVVLSLVVRSGWLFGSGRARMGLRCVIGGRFRRMCWRRIGMPPVPSCDRLFGMEWNSPLFITGTETPLEAVHFGY